MATCAFRTSVPLVIVMAAGSAAATPGDCASRNQRYFTTVSQANAHAGTAVTSNSNELFVGVPDEDTTFNPKQNVGTIYRFNIENDGYDLAERIAAPVSNTDMRFGRSLDVDGQLLIVGGAGGPGTVSGHPQGIAWIFEKDGPIYEVMTALLPPLDPGDDFGFSVAIEGNWAVVGAPYDDDQALNNGAVYIYKRVGDQWFLHQKIAHNVGAEGHYGHCVEIDNGVIVVGAPNADFGGVTDRGMAYIYRFMGGTFELAQATMGGGAGDHHGWDIALDNNVLLVSSPDDDIGPMSSAGSIQVYAYIPQFGQFVDFHTITSPTPGSFQRFGAAIDFKNGWGGLAVSQPASAKAFLFDMATIDNWPQVIATDGGSTTGTYGYDVAVSPIGLIGGDPNDDLGNGFDRGSVRFTARFANNGADDRVFASMLDMIANSSVTVTGCTASATPSEVAEVAGVCAGADAKDVWFFVYDAPGNQSFVAETVGGDYDTVLSVHRVPRQGLATWEVVDCNDDFAPPGRHSRVTFTTDDQYNYYIRVAGWGSASGTFNLHVFSACQADLSGSSDPLDAAYGNADGTVDSSDFFYYLDQFSEQNASVADLTGSADPNDPAYGVPDGVVDAADFFCYLDLFVAGCN